jgi:hypothetical protein
MSVVAQDIEIQLVNNCEGDFKRLEVGRTYGEPWDDLGTTNGKVLKLVQLAAGKEKGLVFDLNIPFVPI